MRSIFVAAAVVAATFAACPSLAQNKKVDKALTYYNSGEYTKCRDMLIKYFPKIKDRPTKGQVSFYIGECSRNLSDSRNAERWYRKAVQAKYSNPLATLYLADALKMRGNYEDASAQYSAYQDLVPQDQRGEQGVKDCETSLEWIKKPTRHIVFPARWLNDREADFAPCFGPDSTILYYTSARESATGHEVNPNSGTGYADIFVSEKDKKGKWSIPVPVAGAINTPYDEGSPYVTPDGNTMYFTSCKNYKNQSLGCRIYVSQLEDNVWTSPEEVVLFRDSTISVGHPSLSPDGKTLYFSSDNPAGMGGKDIWKSTRTGKNSWSEPTNMGGNINTKGDEVYPFAADDGSFYFSSNGRGGMGGLDIFKVSTKNGTSSTENMRSPINSSADDFGIHFFKTFQRGFFSSNREGSRGDDIYGFFLPPIQVSIEGVCKNEETTVVVGEAAVQLTGGDGTQLDTKCDKNGQFRFKLNENIDYMFVSSKSGYLKGIGKETTKGLTENTVLHIELLMTPIAQVVEIENIEYDFNKANLREESKVSLDELVELLNVNNNITIELRANTDFRGSDDDNMKLSEARAQSVVDYLVSKGINADRLSSRGMGESNPVKVTKKIANKYPFLKEGDVLNEDFINALTNNQDKEICHQLNRRSEFAVLRTDFNEHGIQFGSDN
ncbi:MAG: OmpA family protein [Bacteroidales bacterium]|nr:OmpA family protein [Bacteroidales bacterium]